MSYTLSWPTKLVGCCARIVLLLAVLGVLACSSCSKRDTATTQLRTGLPRLVGYLPEYRLRDADPVLLGRYYTDIILYSVDVTKNGGLDTRRLNKRGWPLVKRLRKAGVQRIFACIGGGARSAHFNAATNDRPSRARLVTALLKLCRTRGLDGVDFDWEFPATAHQRAQYDALIVETKAAFAAAGLELSAAVIGRQGLSREALSALDRLHMMAYDNTGEHSTYEFAVDNVRTWLARGVPPAKLSLGVPFYARGVQRRSRALPYSSLAQRNRMDPEVDRLGDMYFNGVSTLARKSGYARQAGLGGIMVWEVGQDASDGKLARVIRKALEVKDHQAN